MIGPGNCILVVYRCYRWCWPLRNSGGLRLESPDPPEPNNGRGNPYGLPTKAVLLQPSQP